jgi:hypothetical protein
MDNVTIFKEFWDSYTSILSKQYDKNNDNLNTQKNEDLIFETKEIFIKNTRQKTGKESSSKELAEITSIVDSFIKS